MFGFGKEGTTNLITKCLEAVGKSLETVPDPTQIHYHLPKSKAHPEVFDASVPFHVRSAVEQKIREDPVVCLATILFNSFLSVPVVIISEFLCQDCSW